LDKRFFISDRKVRLHSCRAVVKRFLRRWRSESACNLCRHFNGSNHCHRVRAAQTIH